MVEIGRQKQWWSWSIHSKAMFIALEWFAMKFWLEIYLFQRSPQIKQRRGFWMVFIQNYQINVPIRWRDWLKSAGALKLAIGQLLVKFVHSWGTSSVEHSCHVRHLHIFFVFMGRLRSTVCFGLCTNLCVDVSYRLPIKTNWQFSLVPFLVCCRSSEMEVQIKCEVCNNFVSAAHKCFLQKISISLLTELVSWSSDSEWGVARAWCYFDRY